MWGFFSHNPSISAPFVVSLPAAIVAAITMLICLISHIKIPEKAYFATALIAYLLIAATAALLIINTGNITSPFVALWMLISLFACVFGVWGLIPVLLSICSFAAYQYLKTGNLSVESIIILVTCGLLPLLASLIIWRKSSATEQASPEKSYLDTKNGQSKVTLKSDIVVNAIGDGVILIDNLGNIKLFNPAAQDITGWEATDALSLNYRSVLKLINNTNTEIDPSSDPVSQVLNLNQQVRTNELGLETKSGKKILISLVVSPLGEVGSGVIAVFHDITKEKSEEREQAEFISTASHEMRTPVAAIEGYLGLAMNPQTATIDIRARDYINSAHQSAQHLGHLFQDLLDVSKADDNRLPNHPQLINIVNFTHEIVREYTAIASQKGLRLIFQPNPDGDNVKHIAPEYSVNLDNEHIREILSNLIDNAIKYTPKGDIVVDVIGSDDHIVISVKDSGIGIPAEDMPHLFQKFYRIDNKDTEQIGGTGLGLYLCRKLAEGMGGRIWAESKEQTGSTFFVQLPRVSSDQANILAEQKSLIAKEQPNSPTPRTQVMDIVKPVNTVPRGQALTPEQIAAYVARQRALAQQQPKPPAAPLPQPAARAQALNIPQRQPR